MFSDPSTLRCSATPKRRQQEWAVSHPPLPSHYGARQCRRAFAHAVLQTASRPSGASSSSSTQPRRPSAGPPSSTRRCRDDDVSASSSSPEQSVDFQEEQEVVEETSAEEEEEPAPERFLSALSSRSPPRHTWSRETSASIPPPPPPSLVLSGTEFTLGRSFTRGTSLPMEQSSPHTPARVPLGTVPSARHITANVSTIRFYRGEHTGDVYPNLGTWAFAVKLLVPETMLPHILPVTNLEMALVDRLITTCSPPAPLSLADVMPSQPEPSRVGAAQRVEGVLSPPSSPFHDKSSLHTDKPPIEAPSVRRRISRWRWFTSKSAPLTSAPITEQPRPPSPKTSWRQLSSLGQLLFSARMSRREVQPVDTDSLQTEAPTTEPVANEGEPETAPPATSIEPMPSLQQQLQSFTVLHERIRSLRCALANVDNDRNALFRALSFSLFGSEDFHAWVRHSAVSQMSQFKDRYAAPFAEGAFAQVRCS